MVACVWQDLADCPLTEQHLESSTDRDASSSCHWCPGCCDEAATDRRLQQVHGWSRPGRSTTPSAHHPPEAPEVVEVSVLLPAGRVDRQHVHCVQGESVRPRDTVASKRRMLKIHAHAWQRATIASTRSTKYVDPDKGETVAIGKIVGRSEFE